MVKKILPCLLIFCLPTVADSAPWFTGPLLASAGHTVDPGHINIEPYFNYADSFGLYHANGRAIKLPNTHTFSISPSVTFGINRFMDVSSTIPQENHYKENQHSSGMGDINFGLGFQALEDDPHTWEPDLRIVISETLPSAPYDNLNASKLGVDALGSGSYRTTLNFNFQKLTKPLAEHYMRTRFSLYYSLHSKAHVVGFNAYGGGFGTDGNVRPGAQFSADLAFEFQLSQNWVPVFEARYSHYNRSSFSGNPGTTGMGTTASIGHGFIDEVTLAPALEYNFNANWGVIAGPWFTVSNINTRNFITGMLAINYYS